VGAIRWDRLGRLALLAMMAGILGLYVGPARSWLSTWEESKERRAEVLQLRAENRRLLARRRELQRPGAVEAEARRLGMVHQGERAYVVRGLPPGR
jgi:cell division protein FtsB